MGRKTKTVDGIRPCRLCGFRLPLSEFYLCKSGKYNSDCKTCTCSRINRGKYNAAVHRRSKLKRRYGLSEKKLCLLIEKQNGRCAICARAGKLVVDHCHKTGIVRGALCSSCNKMLGFSKDSVDCLISAANYLAAIEANQVAEELENQKFGPKN